MTVFHPIYGDVGKKKILAGLIDRPLAQCHSLLLPFKRIMDKMMTAMWQLQHLAFKMVAVIILSLFLVISSSETDWQSNLCFDSQGTSPL